MFSLSDANRFFLYPFPTDMRKSFDSLSGIVKNQMGMMVGGLRASDYKQQKRWAPPPKSL